MCLYVLPLPADTITPVQQEIFVTCGLCQIQSYQAFKAKAKEQDFGLKDQSQGLTSLVDGTIAVSTLIHNEDADEHRRSRKTKYSSSVR